MPDTKIQDKKPTFRFVTNRDLNAKSLELAQSVREQEDVGSIDYIVCINRGGMYLARMLSDMLSIPILSVGVRSYKGINQALEVEMFQDITVDLNGMKVLLVDEICDSGATFAYLEGYLTRLGCSRVVSCCLYVKPHATYKPAYFADTTNDWVVFPYEFSETINSISPFIKNDRKLKQQVYEYFEEAGVMLEEWRKMLS